MTVWKYKYCVMAFAWLLAICAMGCSLLPGDNLTATAAFGGLSVVIMIGSTLDPPETKDFF